MQSRPAAHPSVDVLRAFGIGKLDDASSASVSGHIEACPECRKQVASLSGDSFLNRLKAGHNPNATPAPDKSLLGRSSSPKAAQLSTTPLPPAMNLPPELAGQTQYQIVRELGRGGMGVVYLAKNKLMGRLEVLKVLNSTLLGWPGALERFLREIRAAAQLKHDSIVGAYSATQLGQLLVFAMEYIEGEDLYKLVETRGPLPVAHACYFIQQASLGLQHAFEKDMVHRDIKPQNLILSRDGKRQVVKILDFGLAKANREKSEDPELTGEG